MWRIVGAGLGSLVEIKKEWTLIDLLDATEYLDIEADQKQWQADNQENN